MVRSRNDGEQGKCCGLAGQSGPESFAAAFLNILSENVLLCRILSVVWRFLNVGKPKSMRDLRGEFCEVASFHSTYARSQTKTGCEEPSLFSTRAKYRSGDFCAGKVQTRRTVSPLNTVGTLLLLLPLLLLLLLREAKNSLPTKIGRTEVECRGDHGRRTRAHPRESLDLNAVA